jgi:hypothetical protein
VSSKHLKRRWIGSAARGVIVSGMRMAGFILRHLC